MYTYTPALKQIWHLAAGEASQSQHEFIEPEHLFLGLCKLKDVVTSGRSQTFNIADPDRDQIEEESKRLHHIFSHVGIDATKLRRDFRQWIGTGSFHTSEQHQRMVKRSSASHDAFARAYQLSKQAKVLATTSVHLLIALLDDHQGAIATFLQQQGIDRAMFRSSAFTASVEGNLDVPEPNDAPRGVSDMFPVPISQDLAARVVSSVQETARLSTTESTWEETGPGVISRVTDEQQPIFSPTTPGQPDVPTSYLSNHLAAIYNLNQTLGDATTLPGVFDMLMTQLQQAFPRAQSGAVLLLDEQNKPLLKAHWPHGHVSVSRTLAWRACEERIAFIWSFRNTPPGAVPESTYVQGTQAAIYAPLLCEGQVLGVVCISSSESPAAFVDADCELLRALVSQTALAIRNHTLQQELQRQTAMLTNLKRQFSPRVSERMLHTQGLRLGGERIAPVTILESDIRGFTAMSRSIEPDDVVRILNDMFTLFVPIIFKYDGTVDKYIGDALLAVFGSPEPDNLQWEKAIRASWEMQQAMQQLNERWQKRNLPPCQVGIGIHSGEVVHGFIGSHERMEYTVIGDTVNRASRYCDGAGRGEILISCAVYEHIYHMVHVEPRTLRTKHPDREPDETAYAVQGVRG